MTVNLYRLVAKLCLFLIIFSSLEGVLLFKPAKTSANNLLSVSDTLSTSRLSYYANQYGTVASGSIATISKSGDPGNGPSITNHNLFPGDIVMLGGGYTAHTNYVVDDIIDNADDNKIQLTTAISSGDYDNYDVVISTRSATHQVQLTTVSTIPNGYFRIRVKAGANDATNDDGIPDQDGFDFGTAAKTVTCPGNATTTYDFVTGTATASGGTYCPSGYHCFECPYSGTSATGTAFNGTVGASDGKFQIDSLINPAPASTHTEGTADSYKVIVEQLDRTHTVIDSTTVSLAVIESVRVTAIVDPILNFTIGGLGAGSYCGTTSGTITTTATTVPFSTLGISNFVDAAQQLTVSTNAAGGYSVVAWENDQLSKNGDGVITIPDTTCNNGGCTRSSAQDWTSTVAKGFGYTLKNNDAESVDFDYDSCASGGYGAFCARPFGVAVAQATQLFSGTTFADNQDIYVCYRIVVSASQQAGNYENYLTYRATATF